MRCDKCNKEWSVAKATSIASFCPFCGSVLNKIDPTVNDTETAMQIIKKIVDAYGRDIIMNTKLFLALFGDLAPHLKKEKKIFSISMTNDIMSLFENCDENERIKRINRARSLLEDILSDEAIDQFLGCVSYALGWEYEKITEKTAVSKQEPTAEIIDLSKYSSMSIDEKATIAIEQLHKFNYCEAELLLNEVADAGHINGYYGLGCLYFDRDKNKKKALDYLNKAIEMGPDIYATSAKYMCAVIYSTEENIDSCFKAVEYYESILDEGENTNEIFLKNAREALDEIRCYVLEKYVTDGKSQEQITLDALKEMSYNNDESAKKILKTPIIMGCESSWFVMGLLCYKNNCNKEALMYLNRYIKRSIKQEYNEKVFAVLGNIYEEEADSSKNDIQTSQLLYMNALSAIRSAINCNQDDRENIKILKESEERLLKKCSVSTADEIDIEDEKKTKTSETSSNSLLSSVSQNQKKSSKQNLTITLHQRYLEVLRLFENENLLNCYLVMSDKIEKNGKLKKKIAKKIDGAISTYAQDAVLEDVYLIFDTTLFGSGKEGFMMTAERLYWKHGNVSDRVKLVNIDKVYLKKIKSPDGYELRIYYYDNYSVRCEANLCNIWSDREANVTNNLLEAFVNIRKEYDIANKN